MFIQTYIFIYKANETWSVPINSVGKMSLPFQISNIKQSAETSWTNKTLIKTIMFLIALHDYKCMNRILRNQKGENWEMYFVSSINWQGNKVGLLK